MKYTGLECNNMTKIFDDQILANSVNTQYHFPIVVLLMIMNSTIFVWHLGHHPHLNTTWEASNQSALCCVTNLFTKSAQTIQSSFRLMIG